jgi:hypothetical protein
LKDVLSTSNLHLNPYKTEIIHISRETYADLPNVKLGNILSSSLEIQSRISAADKAFSRLWRIWLSDRRIPDLSRLRIYKACVESVFLYNTSCIALPESSLAALDIAHRRHLRRVLRIYYPMHVSNESLYIAAATEPLSLRITESRWKLFGHILRRPGTPAFVATREFFQLEIANTPKYGTRSTTSLPNLLHQDIHSLPKEATRAYSINNSLSSTRDLDKLIALANNRARWIAFVEVIMTKTRQRIYSKISPSDFQISRNSRLESSPIPLTPSHSSPRSDGRHSHRTYSLGLPVNLMSAFDDAASAEERYSDTPYDVDTSYDVDLLPQVVVSVLTIRDVLCVFTISALLICLIYLL